MINFALFDMDKEIFYLTAGEIPSTSGLHASQIIEAASFFSQQGHKVHWIAAVPFLSFIKNTIFKTNKISEVKRHCEKLNIEFIMIFTLWNFNGVITFPFRKYLIKRTARKIYKIIKFDEKKYTIFHGRSYYATQMAIYLKKLLNTDRGSLVSFDMRSLAPEEMPLTRGLTGYFYYGFYKKWEYDLILKSDISFLPLKSGCTQIKKELGLNVTYAPIQGFDREVDYEPDFDERWINKFAGYSGSFGDYQDPELLKEMLHQIQGVNPFFATPPNDSLKDYRCVSYPFSEMKNYYKKLLFLIIPGVKTDGDYFKTLKMRTNFFSTKASEALSMGVPLFVSSYLAELVSFIEEHECGIIYDAKSKKIIYPLEKNMLDEAYWRKLTKNAFAAGKAFTRQNVLRIYADRWDQVISSNNLEIK